MFSIDHLYTVVHCRIKEFCDVIMFQKYFEEANELKVEMANKDKEIQGFLKVCGLECGEWINQN